MNYLRLSEGLGKNYKLVPVTENIWNYVKNPNGKDYYVSLYQYNDEHYKTWKETNSVAGLSGVTTNRLYFDFDNASDIDKAREDAVTVVTRLLEHGLPKNSIQVNFSGNKGFSVEVDTTDTFTPEEFKSTVFALADGLDTFDPVVNDSQRLVRLTGTKHMKSGLYKMPITIEQLTELPVEAIKDIAKDYDNNVDSDLIESYQQVQLPPSIASFKKTKKEKPKLELVNDLDLSKKPKWLSAAKFALQEGFFGSGERNTAFMILATSYRNQGFSKEIVYRMLKGVAERQAARNNVERYSDKELFHNVVEVVYSPTWKGGTYSYDNTPLLQDVTKRLNLKRETEGRDELIGVQNVTSTFKDFALNIDKNTIKLGIDLIDKNVTITTSMLTCLLAAPSAGKCLGKGTMVRMFDGSIKAAEDIKIGDVLMGDDSLPRNVLSITSGREELFKVKQLNGDDYVVNRSHILSLRSDAVFSDPNKHRKFSSQRIKDVPVYEYINWNKSMKKYYKGYKVGCEYPARPVDFNPYILGVWLGDGTSSKPQITNVDSEVINYFLNWGKEHGLDSSTHSPLSYNLHKDGSVSNNHLTDMLRKYNLFNNKHIPKFYLHNSYDVRRQVLAGLLDTDGYYDESKGAYELTFNNERLADDTVELVRSLGIRCTKARKVAKYKSFTKGKWYIGEQLVYRMYIAGEELAKVPCKVERRKYRKVDSKTNSLSYGIELESLGEGDYYGFEIDGNRRFLLKDFTVTHNTSVSLSILNSNSLRGTNSIFFSLDMGAPLVYQRLIQKHTGLTGKDIFKAYKDNDVPKIKEMEDAVTKNYSNVKFSFKSGITVEMMKEMIMSENEKGNKIKLVVLDYLECVTGPFSDSTANSSFIAQQLKDLANELELTVLLLVQPQKQAGDPSDELLSYRKIKGSSAIEQAASVIFTLWRPGFNPKKVEEDKYASIAVVKNRMGSLNKFDFAWEGLRGDLCELDEYEKEDLDKLVNRRLKEKMNTDLI